MLIVDGMQKKAEKSQINFFMLTIVHSKIVHSQNCYLEMIKQSSFRLKSKVQFKQSSFRLLYLYK